MLKVVVVGGGFAGLRVVRLLRNQKNIHLTLVTDRHSFRYCPALYRTATGITMKASAIPISQIVADAPSLKVKFARVTHIGRAEKELRTAAGEVIPYDIVVLALGAIPTYFGIPGIKEHAYSISSAYEITRLRKHLHDHLIDEKAPDRNYIVVGGGPTGIEVSAGMNAYLRTIIRQHRLKRRNVRLKLVEAADRLMPNAPKHESRRITARLKKLGVDVMTGTKVKSETDHTLKTDKETFPTETVIWTAGVENNHFFKNNDFALDKRGKVVVDEHLQVNKSVFVIGDNADSKYSGLALTAVHNGTYVAKQIRRLASKKSPRKYRPFKPVSVIPVGENWAVLQWGHLVISGFLMSIVRKVADLIGYHDIMRLSLALKIWHNGFIEEETCKVCIKNKR